MIGQLVHRLEVWFLDVEVVDRRSIQFYFFFLVEELERIFKVVQLR